MLIAVIGTDDVLWINAACYAISAITLGLVPGQLSGARQPEAQPAKPRADIREGLRYVRRHPAVWSLTISGFGSALGSGTLVGLIVIYGVRQLELATDDARLGWLYTAVAIGGFAAGLTLPALSRRVNQPRISLAGLTAELALLSSHRLALSREKIAPARLIFVRCHVTDRCRLLSTVVTDRM